MVDTTLSQARRMNTPRAIAFCQCFNGALEFQAGNWDDAETALRESFRLNAEIGAASGEAFARQRLGVVLTARGQLEEGKAVLQEGAAVAERAIMRAHWRECWAIAMNGWKEFQKRRSPPLRGRATRFASVKSVLVSA